MNQGVICPLYYRLIRCTEPKTQFYTREDGRLNFNDTRLLMFLGCVIKNATVLSVMSTGCRITCRLNN